MKPILFLLQCDFIDTQIDQSQKFYCPHCAMIEGVLHYYPDLRDHLDIRYVDFPRPRKEIIALVGEENQGCPLLITSLDNQSANSFSVLGNMRFTNDTKKIATFFANQFHVGLWHP